MELIGASWIIFIKYTSYILLKLKKLKYLENLPVFFKILLVGYCIHINSVKSANKIVPYFIFYSTPWFEQCDILDIIFSLDLGKQINHSLRQLSMIFLSQRSKWPRKGGDSSHYSGSVRWNGCSPRKYLTLSKIGLITQNKYGIILRPLRIRLW